MDQETEIILHYFDVRGRGQFIRALLSEREIPFVDDRVVLNEDNSSWLETRKDRNISGAFQKLPTLQWGAYKVSEVLVILDFLHRQLGDEDRLDEHNRLRHAMLTSSAFHDLLSPCINLIWADVFHPGADVGETARAAKGRLERHLATVDQTLSEWQWLKGVAMRPVMGADAVLWEALDMIGETFAGGVDMSAFPQLAAFYEQCPGRETFQRLLREKPRSLTARPGEAGALTRIQAA